MKKNRLHKFKKAISFICVFSLLFLTCIFPVCAQTTFAASEENTQANIRISPRADKFIYKYRKTKEGILERRLWNSTKGQWAEPRWTKVS